MNSASPRPQVVDQEVRDAVLARDVSFVVQAPAGSGKTELLIQRYLTLLADPAVDEPESVLAITFTRKAAAEMRNRVRDALEAAAIPEQKPGEPHKKKTRELAIAVLSRDAERGWNLLHDVSRINIRTLDSLCEQIVQSGPYRAGFGSRLAVTEDAGHLYREAARRTVLMLGGRDETISEAVEHLLDASDAHAPTLEDLLAAMLEKRDQWLPMLKDAGNPATVQKELQSALAAAVEEDLARTNRELAEILGPQLPKFLSVANRSDLPSDLESWRELRECCFTGGNDVRKSSTFLKQLEQSPASEALRGIAKRIQRLPNPKYTEDEWRRLQALLTVLPAAERELASVFAERGQTDFVEVARAAEAVLKDDGPSGARHILVDEFQDTSVLQVHLLRSIMASWQQGDGRTIFLVGDPMQSIYSFRKAEVMLFERARDRDAHLLPRDVEAREITVNFRSQKSLVDWFNATFAQMMKGTNPITGAVGYARGDSAHPAEEPAVEVRSFPAGDLASEAEYIAESIGRELAANTDPKFRIAVLARARGHLAQIVTALRLKKIRFRAVGIDPLGERTAIRDLLALARALTHLGDRTAWLTVLRAPWCGLTLADLTTLCGDRESHQQTVFELISMRRTKLSADAQTRLARVMPVLEASIARRGRVSLRALVEHAWTALGGPAAVRSREDGDSDLRDAAAIFEFLDQHASAGELPDEKILAQAAERLFSPADSDPSVRVELMTMHGAKGLEFDVVFVPGLGRKPQGDGQALLYWREFMNGNEQRLLLAPFDPLREPKNSDASIAGYIRQAQRDASREEAKRLLYVGCTRAEHRLYLTFHEPGDKKDGNPRKPDKESFLALLRGIESFEQLVKEGPIAVPATQPAVPNLRRLKADWAPPRVEPAFSWSAPRRLERDHTFEWVGRKQRAVGTVTHRFLQQIGRDGLDRWTEAAVRERAKAIRATLSSEGVNAADLAAATGEVIDGLCAILAHDKGRWILAAHPEADCEFPLSGTDDGIDVRLKLDRTFVDEQGTRWIVDYKMATTTSTAVKKFLDQQQEKYRRDLERYARVMQQFDPRPVRLGLYFPLLREWREVEAPAQSSSTPVQQNLFPK